MILPRTDNSTRQSKTRLRRSIRVLSMRLRTFRRSLLLALASIGAILLFTFALYAAWVSKDLPNPNVLTNRSVAQSTRIYDRTGKILLYEIHGDKKRTLVKIDDIPDHTAQAAIAIEDKRFYQHRGIYWKGIARAVILRLTFQRARLQGASTLTQQLVKNAILTNERTALRKIKEFILAFQIERAYSKKQILQMYLNEIPYGSTIYGIESAAQSYFGKSARDLTLDESALLASLPQAPDFYSPYGTGSRGDHRDKLRGRQRTILDLMVEQGYVSSSVAESAKQIDTLKKLKPLSLGSITAPHFVMDVREQLLERYGERVVTQGGLTVFTSLDVEKQRMAEGEVRKGATERGKKYGFTNASLVSLDPHTGEILALVGSQDFFDTEHDGQFNVSRSKRQPGSSFKPIVYAAGFMRGYLPQTELWDVQTSFRAQGKTYEPHNYDSKERGPVSIRAALQFSLNIPAVKMLYLVGVGRVIDFAETLGYTSFEQRSRFGLSLVLGGGEVVPIEHAAAYAAFANEGLRVQPVSILKVTDADGATLEEWKVPTAHRVMEPQIARLVSDVLSDNTTRAAFFGARNPLTLPDRPVAAKTGTTNDFHDAWTIGYTPDLVAVVWVGNNDNTPMKRGADGSVVAAPIWQGFMRQATRVQPIRSFTPPDPPETTKPALLGRVTQQMVQMDRISGKRATERTPLEFRETRPSYEAHTILFYVDKDDPSGPIPSNPANDPQFEAWESSVQRWVQERAWHTTNTIPLLYDDVHIEQNKPQVTLLSPTPSQVLTNRLLMVDASITVPRAIQRVDIQINGTPLGSITSAPWKTSVLIPNTIDVGSHTVSVTATDDVGNQGTVNVPVLLSATREELTNIAITSPAPSSEWSITTFPRTIDVALLDPSQYERIEVFLENSFGNRTLLATEQMPSNPSVQFVVLHPPSIGVYQLRVIGFYRDGMTHDQVSSTLSITH